MQPLTWIYLYLGLAVLLIGVADTLRRYFNFRYQLYRPSVLLELTPPAYSKKAPNATEHLYSVMYTLGRPGTFKDRLLGRSDRFAPEVVSSRSEGIRFLMRLSAVDLPIFQQQLAAYMPDVQFRVVDDYLQTALNSDVPARFMEFQQARHYAFPLASHDSLAQHDPIAYITGSMTKLAPDELIAFQLVLSPVAPREATRISNKLILGKDPDLYRKSRPLLLKLVLFLISLPVLMVRLALAFIVGFMSSTESANAKHYRQPAVTARAPEYQALLASLSSKLSQRLFRVSIRAVVITEDTQRAQQTMTGISAALSSFAVPGFQGLISKRHFPFRLTQSYRRFSYTNRLIDPIMKYGCVLSIAEVASLYHFPYGDTARPENLSTSHSRTLPASFALKHSADTGKFDVILGVNKHHGGNTTIGLRSEERERHMYVLGGTGNGKTTMLQYAIVQDIKNGKGVAVIDPHGDLAQDLLKYVPQERIKDVIYFNPYDLSHPIALNLLELPKDLDPDAKAHQQDFLTEAIVSIFRKIFSDDDSGGHRIESTLRNTIHTAFTVPDATLFTLYDLLTDPEFRKKVVGRLKDKRLKQFWNNEYGRAGSYQQVKMAGGVTNKLGRFDRSECVRRVMEQATSTIDFDDIINSGKILICNFAKGDIGDDTSELFGIAVLAKLQLAAQHRSRIAPAERRPFYLYVDEFQNFATMSFVQLLAEARKFKLFLTMAEQSTAQQQEQRIVHIILDNVGTVVCFRAGSSINEKLILPIFRPLVQEGEIANLPAYNFYMSIRAVQTQEPMSGETLLLEDAGSEKVAEEVIAESRQRYATVYVPKAEVQDEDIEPETDDTSGLADAGDPVSG